MIRGPVVCLAAAAVAGCSALGASPGPPGAASRPAAATPVTPATGAARAAGAAGAAGAAQGDARLVQAQRTHEYPTPAPRQTAAPGAATPTAALVAFASVYINWTAANVPATMRLLAAASIGQARSAMQLAAGETARDDELRRGGIANSGTVEAIAPVVGGSDQYAVVTRERTTATATGAYQGLAPAWHLTLATVSRQANGKWVLSGWQPEN